MAIEPMHYCFKNNIPYIEGNIIKYVSRWRVKGGLNDLHKALHYLQYLIVEEEAKEAKPVIKHMAPADISEPGTPEDGGHHARQPE